MKIDCIGRGFGRPEVLRLVRKDVRVIPSVAERNLSARPTASTPGIVCKASIMRFCTAGNPVAAVRLPSPDRLHDQCVPHIETEVIVQ